MTLDFLSVVNSTLQQSHGSRELMTSFSRRTGCMAIQQLNGAEHTRQKLEMTRLQVYYHIFWFSFFMLDRKHRMVNTENKNSYT